MSMVRSCSVSTLFESLLTAVDPHTGANDHSACMNLFNTNGIYVIADLGLPLNGSINRADPSWDVSCKFLFRLLVGTITIKENYSVE